MEPELREWIERRFAVPRAGAPKVTSLRAAIADNVRAGDTIHLGVTHSRGSAANWELVRQFIGADPGFTLAGVTFSSPFAPLVHAGLARKIVTSWAGDSYWTPGPNGAYQRAWNAGIPFEHWSILTFGQRLAAAARGVSHATTHSLVGSAMERNDGVEIRGETAFIPALRPDVSIFHAPAADEYGNVLFSPPMMEDVHGALAAKRGAIVTVDRVVDSDFLRAHAHMARIPSSAVAAVVEAPFGAHPGGLLPTGIAGMQGYVEDYEFWVDIRNAAKDPGAFDAWIKEWILEPATHEGYVARLGSARLEALQARTTVEWAARDLEEGVARIDFGEEPNAIEWAIVAAARELRARIASNGYTTMLAGAGMANLAAWIAAYDLAGAGINVDLVAEMGLVGYWPRPMEPILFNQRNFPTCTMLAGVDQTLGVIVGGASARSIGALGAAQVDKHGNINSTEIPGRMLLMGSGGANDVITSATETLVVATQTKERFLDRVDYVTGPGGRVQTLVSTLGVYRKDGGELILTGVFGDPDESAREAVARCGWPLRVARTLDRIAPPNPDELRMLRLFDPNAWFRK
jgi:acyl CoA:acetate/3-ketoacid CoA transferase alpha subunit/acyl CoA:acetate/3-ketoacid CoA transferase beta subunit